MLFNHLFALPWPSPRRMPSTGIAYAADLVVTANHALERDDDVNIFLGDGRTNPAVVAGHDPVRDIASLRLSEAVLTPAAATTTAALGSTGAGIGAPGRERFAGQPGRGQR